MPTYASLGEIKSQMKAGTASNTVEDDSVLALARAASAYVDRTFQQRRPYFFPYSETRQFRVDGYHVNSYDNTFTFNDNLLALTSLSVGGQSVSAVEAWPTLETPYHYLRLTNTSDSWQAYCTTDSSPNFATVTGVWGMHRDYANAWLQVDALAAAITTTTATTFTVADVDGYDANYRLPRISAGQLIKVDSEYMEVTHTETGTNTVTVRRGVHGTTAATHLISAAVCVWQVEDTIRSEVARQVGYMYARRGAYENARIDGIGITEFPPSVVGALAAALGGFAYGS